jgi:hypothetical protein
MLVWDCCTVTFLCAVQFEVSASAASFLKGNPRTVMSSYLNTISLSIKKVHCGDSCFFHCIIYRECLISQLSVICALHCPALVLLMYTHLPTPYKLFLTVYVSRGLQWSRLIKAALPANPHVANYAFLLRLDCLNTFLKADRMLMSK